MEKVRSFLSSKNRGVRHGATLPKLPLIVLFAYWSLLIHLTLYLLLNEFRQDAPPGKSTTLTLRLAQRAEPQPTAPAADVFAETVSDMSPGLQPSARPGQTLENTAAASEAPVPEHPEAPGEATVSGSDYYYKSSELDARPVPLSPVNPVYPEPAMQQDIAGYAVLLILLDEQGQVHHIDVLESSPLDAFGDAAMKAFRAAPFSPGRKGLMPVKSQMMIRVDFLAAAAAE